MRKRKDRTREREKERKERERERRGNKFLDLRLLLFAVRVCTARVCPFFFLVLVRVCFLLTACNLLEDDTAFLLGFFFLLGTRPLSFHVVAHQISWL